MDKDNKQNILDAIKTEAELLKHEAALLKHEAELLDKEISLLEEGDTINNNQENVNNNTHKKHNNEYNYKHNNNHDRPKKGIIDRFYSKYNLKLFVYRKYIYLVLLGLIVTLGVINGFQYFENKYLRTAIDKKNDQVVLIQAQFEKLEEELEVKNNEIANFSELIDSTFETFETLKKACKPHNNYKDSIKHDHEHSEYVENENYDNIYMKDNALAKLKEKYESLKNNSTVPAELFIFKRKDREDYK